MKFDIMCIGTFPDSTLAELACRYNMQHFFKLPDPANISDENALRKRAGRPEGLRGKKNISDELCRREGIAALIYFGWSGSCWRAASADWRVTRRGLRSPPRSRAGLIAGEAEHQALRQS